MNITGREIVVFGLVVVGVLLGGLLLLGLFWGLGGMGFGMPVLSPVEGMGPGMMGPGKGVGHLLVAADLPGSSRATLPRKRAGLKIIDVEHLSGELVKLIHMQPTQSL